MAENNTSNQTWTVVKDIFFLALALWLISTRNVFGILVGAFALYWYGKDLYTRVGARRARKQEDRPARPQGGPSKPAAEDGKIQVTDLSGAKEVDFEKE